MSIPATVKIGGHVFRIESTEDSPLDGSYGATRVSQDQIWISPRVCVSQRDSTLLHEVIEAIDEMYELKLEHNQISTLETALHAFLVENDWRPGE